MTLSSKVMVVRVKLMLIYNGVTADSFSAQWYLYRCLIAPVFLVIMRPQEGSISPLLAGCGRCLIARLRNVGELIAFTRRRHRRVNVPAKTDALPEKMR